MSNEKIKMPDVLNNTFKLFKPIFGILLMVLSFMIQDAWRTACVTLAKINADIVDIKVHLKEVDTRFMSEEKIRKIIQDEIIKAHYDFEHSK